LYLLGAYLVTYRSHAGVGLALRGHLNILGVSGKCCFDSTGGLAGGLAINHGRFAASDVAVAFCAAIFIAICLDGLTGVQWGYDHCFRSSEAAWRSAFDAQSLTEASTNRDIIMYGQKTHILFHLSLERFAFLWAIRVSI